MNKFVFVLLAITLNFSVSSADVGSEFANSKCVKCHSADSSDTSFPSLGAQTPEYLYQSMRDYQTGVRKSSNAVMMMAKRLKSVDDATIRALADFYSKAPAPAPAAGDATQVALGKDIYDNGIQSKSVRACSDCHGRDAEGRGAGIGMNPRLAGQQQDFVVTQLQNYKSGSITNQKEMSDIASKLTDGEMTAVAAYLRSK